MKKPFKPKVVKKDIHDELANEGDACSLPGPARGGYRDEKFEDELFDALTEEETEDTTIPVKDILPIPIKISDRNLELGYLIGPITAMIGKRDFEVGGFFTTDLGDANFSLTDFIVPKDLPVAPGAILIAEQYPRTADELKELNDLNGTQRRLSAMFHIHPSKNGTGLFHSGDDDRGLSSLVNKMAEVNRVVLESPYKLIESKIKKEYGDNHLVLRGDELSDAIVRLVYPNDQLFYQLLKDFGINPEKGFNKEHFLGKLLEMVDHKTTEPRAIRFATSFVFENDRKGPYIKMEIDERFALTGTVKSYTYTNPKFEIIQKGENLPSEEEVVKLVMQRVRFPPKPKAVKFKGTNQFGQIIVGGGFEGDEDDMWDGVVGRGTYTPAKGQTYSSPYYNQGVSNLGKWDAKAQRYVKENVEKVSPDKLTLEDLATNFAIQAYGYISQSRNSECKYSQYFGKLFDKVSAYSSPGTYYLGSGNTYAVKQDTDKGNLRQIVLELGELAEDPQSFEPVDISSYRLKDMAENVVKYQKIGSDLGTVKFMKSFIEAPDLSSRNQLFAEYVNGVHQDYRQGLLKALETPVIVETSSKIVKPDDKPSAKPDDTSLSYD